MHIYVHSKLLAGPPISGTSQLKSSSLAERPLAVAPASSGRCPATFLKALNSCPSRNIVFGRPENVVRITYKSLQIPFPPWNPMNIDLETHWKQCLTYLSYGMRLLKLSLAYELYTPRPVLTIPKWTCCLSMPTWKAAMGRVRRNSTYQQLIHWYFTYIQCLWKTHLEFMDFFTDVTLQ